MHSVKETQIYFLGSQIIKKQLTLHVSAEVINCLEDLCHMQMVLQ